MKKRYIILGFLVVFLFMCPVNIRAEGNAIENAEIYLDDIVYGETPKKEIEIVSGPHLQSTEMPLIWYASENGVDYTVMDETETFDYNIYYKVVFGRSFSEINDRMDEGWECSSIELKIYDKEGTVIDTKKYTASDSFEYVYEPIWKYSVTTQLEHITYEGPIEVVEGGYLSARLVPEKKYRFPNESEIEMEHKLMVMSKGVSVPYTFDSSTGNIYINPEDIKGDIQIWASGVEKKMVAFIVDETKVYVIEDSEANLEFYIDNENEEFNNLYINDTEVDISNYEFFEDMGLLRLKGDFLNTLTLGAYSLRLENDNSYAETSFVIEEADEEDEEDEENEAIFDTQMEELSSDSLSVSEEDEIKQEHYSNAENESSNDEDQSPEMGDDNSIESIIYIGVISLLGIIASLVFKRISV